ncbi:conserved protein, unknown function [Hepatocystis sp. ex Piliocolobus tephrosceles]|nr:conserved protein, unknown function [Hepatocystis sp. ex Piliocolobus tephrosceles]
MLKNELDYLKFIICDIFGNCCSEIVEIILLYGNKLTINEIINLSNYEFRIVRNVLLCLLIHNVVDTRIVYNKLDECTHIKLDCIKKNSNNSISNNNNLKNTSLFDDEEEKQQNGDDVDLFHTNKQKNGGNGKNVKKTKKREIEKVAANVDTDITDIQNQTDMLHSNDNIQLLLEKESNKYMKGCRCDFCTCKIKRVEYFVIIINIYTLIRYSSILYYIHPTGIKEKNENKNQNNNQYQNINTVNNKYSSFNNISMMNSRYGTNKATSVGTTMGINSHSVNYNFFHSDIGYEERYDTSNENITDDSETLGNVSTSCSNNGMYNNMNEENEYLYAKECADLEKKQEIIQFIEKVLLIRIIKNGRITIENCIKNIKCDDYIEVCKTLIPNMSAKKLKLIFIQMIKKKYIKKCKYFNEHICENDKGGNAKQAIYNNLINYINLNVEDSYRDNNVVGIHEKYSSNKIYGNIEIHNENCVDNGTFLNSNNNIHTINNQYSNDILEETQNSNIRSSKRKKTNTSNIKKTKKKGIVNDNISFGKYNYEIGMTNTTNELGNTKKNSFRKNQEVRHIHNYSQPNNSKQNLKNKDTLQNNLLEYLDNPFTYFQANNEMLTQLYFKQEIFHFICNYYTLNETSKCIYFFLLTNVHLYYVEGEHKCNGTVSYSPFDAIQKYVIFKLKKKNIHINKNIVLQNLNKLMKCPDQIIIHSQCDDIITYAANFTNIKEIYKNKIVCNIIEHMNGSDGLRIWSFLIATPDEKLNDEMISENVLIPLNNVRKTLYNLLYHGYIKSHECNNSFNNNNVNDSNKQYIKHSLSFSTNIFYTHNKIKEILFSIAKNIFIRKFYENNQINVLHNKLNICIKKDNNKKVNENGILINSTSNVNNSNISNSDMITGQVNNIYNNSEHNSSSGNSNYNIHSNINNIDNLNNEKKKKNSLIAREYAVDYLEISLINLDKLIFTFNS